MIVKLGGPGRSRNRASIAWDLIVAAAAFVVLATVVQMAGAIIRRWRLW